MAEIGLIHFAHVGRKVAEAAVPPYRSRYSKHTITRPNPLTTLNFIRYEDWTYREIEIRLREHAKLHGAHGLVRAPDYTTLYRSLRQLGEDELMQLLRETIRQMSSLPLPRGRR